MIPQTESKVNDYGVLATGLSDLFDVFFDLAFDLITEGDDAGDKVGAFVGDVNIRERQFHFELHFVVAPDSFLDTESGDFQIFFEVIEVAIKQGKLA